MFGRFITSFVVFAMVAGQAHAQDNLAVPGVPEHPEIDANGVSISQGVFNLETADLSIGTPSLQSAIEFRRQYPAGYPISRSAVTVDTWLPFGWSQTHNYDIRIYCNITDQDLYDAVDPEDPLCHWHSFYLVSGTSTTRFNRGIGISEFTTESGDERAIMVNHPQFGRSTMEVRAKDGSLLLFPIGAASESQSCGARCLFVRRIQYPNNETVNFSYEASSAYVAKRLVEVVSNTGLGLHFTYASPPSGSGNNFDPKSHYIAMVQTFHQECLHGCSRTTGASKTYGYTMANYSSQYSRRASYLTSTLDINGSTITYTWTGSDAYEKIKRVSRANSGASIVELTVLDDKVTGYKDQSGAIWLYNYLPQYTEVTDPTGAKTTYGLASVNNESRVVSVKLPWALGSGEPIYTTALDGLGRTIEQVDPRGIKRVRQYDANSNVVLETIKPVPGSGLPDIITSASYPACTEANFKICHKPSYRIDPRQVRTDYSWSEAHGGLLSETKGLNAAGGCALPGNICPTTTYGYTTFAGIDGAAIHLVTSKQDMIDASNVVTTTWSYRPASEGLTMREQVVSSGGVSQRTCFQYDRLGNLISKTSPRAALSSCP